MEDGIVVPQIDTNDSNRSNTVAPAVAALTGNDLADVAAIAKELGVADPFAANQAQQPKPVAQPQVAPPPVVPQAAPKAETVEVPPKFQNPDGTVNEAKLDKSKQSLAEKLAEFKAMEREYNQKQNKINNPPQVPVQPQPLPQNPTQLSPLEYQMAQDLINESAAQGFTLDHRQAIAQARVMARGLEAKHAAEQSLFEELKRENADNRMTAELKDLIDADEGFLTKATAERVLAIRAEKGGSYRDAYIQHLGEEAIRQRTGQVKTPIPTGQTVKAPPTPVGPVLRVQPAVSTANPHDLSNEQLEAEIRKIHPRFRG